MEQSIYKRKSDGVYSINLKRTWEKLLLAAQAIVAITNPVDVSVVSSRNTGQKAELTFIVVIGRCQSEVASSLTISRPLSRSCGSW